MKRKRIIIPCLLQKQILQQLHNNHMGIEKIAVKHEYGGPRTHGVVEEANNTYHNGWSYIRLSKTGTLIIQNMRHICGTPITME